MDDFAHVDDDMDNGHGMAGIVIDDYEEYDEEYFGEDDGTFTSTEGDKEHVTQAPCNRSTRLSVDTTYESSKENVPHSEEACNGGYDKMKSSQDSSDIIEEVEEIEEEEVEEEEEEEEEEEGRERFNRTEVGEPRVSALNRLGPRLGAAVSNTAPVSSGAPTPTAPSMTPAAPARPAGAPATKPIPAKYAQSQYKNIFRRIIIISNLPPSCTDARIKEVVQSKLRGHVTLDFFDGIYGGCCAVGLSSFTAVPAVVTQLNSVLVADCSITARLMTVQDHATFWSRKLSCLSVAANGSDANDKWLVVLRNISVNCPETWLFKTLRSEVPSLINLQYFKESSKSTVSILAFALLPTKQDADNFVAKNDERIVNGKQLVACPYYRGFVPQQNKEAKAPPLNSSTNAAPAATQPTSTENQREMQQRAARAGPAAAVANTATPDRDRSPAAAGGGGSGGQAATGVVAGPALKLNNHRELLQKSKGTNHRVSVHNIAYTVNEDDMIKAVNGKVGGLQFILPFRNNQGCFNGNMLLEFVSPVAAKKFLKTMQRFKIKARPIFLKMDTDASRDPQGNVLSGPAKPSQLDGSTETRTPDAGLSVPAPLSGPVEPLANFGQVAPIIPPLHSMDIGPSRPPHPLGFAPVEPLLGSRLEPMLPAAPVHGLPEPVHDTYGLSPQYLDNLNIVLPLVPKVLLSNVDPRCTDNDVGDLLSLAGTVATVQVNRALEQAIVEMSHPVEAVEAVSRLHNRIFYERSIAVRLCRQRDFEIFNGLHPCGDPRPVDMPLVPGASLEPRIPPAIPDMMAINPAFNAPAGAGLDPRLNPSLGPLHDFRPSMGESNDTLASDDLRARLTRPGNRTGNVPATPRGGPAGRGGFGRGTSNDVPSASGGPGLNGPRGGPLGGMGATPGSMGGPPGGMSGLPGSMGGPPGGMGGWGGPESAGAITVPFLSSNKGLSLSSVTDGFKPGPERGGMNAPAGRSGQINAASGRGATNNIGTGRGGQNTAAGRGGPASARGGANNIGTGRGGQNSVAGRGGPASARGGANNVGAGRGGQTTAAGRGAHASVRGGATNAVAGRDSSASGVPVTGPARGGVAARGAATSVAAARGAAASNAPPGVGLGRGATISPARGAASNVAVGRGATAAPARGAVGNVAVGLGATGSVRGAASNVAVGRGAPARGAVSNVAVGRGEASNVAVGRGAPARGAASNVVVGRGTAVSPARRGATNVAIGKGAIVSLGGGAVPNIAVESGASGNLTTNAPGSVASSAPAVAAATSAAGKGTPGNPGATATADDKTATNVNTAPTSGNTNPASKTSGPPKADASAQGKTVGVVIGSSNVSENESDPNAAGPRGPGDKTLTSGGTWRTGSSDAPRGPENSDAAKTDSITGGANNPAPTLQGAKTTSSSTVTEKKSTSLNIWDEAESRSSNKDQRTAPFSDRGSFRKAETANKNQAGKKSLWNAGNSGWQGNDRNNGADSFAGRDGDRTVGWKRDRNSNAWSDEIAKAMGGLTDPSAKDGDKEPDNKRFKKDTPAGQDGRPPINSQNRVQPIAEILGNPRNVQDNPYLRSNHSRFGSDRDRSLSQEKSGAPPPVWTSGNVPGSIGGDAWKAQTTIMNPDLRQPPPLIDPTAALPSVMSGGSNQPSFGRDNRPNNDYTSGRGSNPPPQGTAAGKDVQSSDEFQSRYDENPYLTARSAPYENSSRSKNRAPNDRSRDWSKGQGRDDAVGSNKGLTGLYQEASRGTGWSGDAAKGVQDTRQAGHRDGQSGVRSSQYGGADGSLNRPGAMNELSSGQTAFRQTYERRDGSSALGEMNQGSAGYGATSADAMRRGPDAKGYTGDERFRAEWEKRAALSEGANTDAANRFGANSDRYSSENSRYGSNSGGGYGANSRYGSNMAGYGAEASRYGGDAGGQRASTAGYPGVAADRYSGTNASGYGANSSAYGANSSSYGTSSAGYGTGVGGYGASAGGYGATTGGYGALAGSQAAYGSAAAGTRDPYSQYGAASTERGFGLTEPSALSRTTLFAPSQSAKLILNNLPSRVQWKDIMDMCSTFGVVRNIDIDSKEMKCRVLFDNPREAAFAARDLNDRVFRGSTLRALVA